MKKVFTISALMASMFLISLNVSAADMHTKGFMEPAMRAPSVIEANAQRKAEMEKRRAEIDRRLGVTEEQKTQLKTIHEKAKIEIAPKVRQLTEVEHEIAVLEHKQVNKERYNINTLENVPLSGKSLEQLKNEQKALNDEIRKIKMSQFEESQKVFTDEQKKELEKMRQERERETKKANKDAHLRMPPKY
ncbi:MAG: hypothetical protein K6A44_03015 [bacterium]|nr:hypothetical protein [bacterium]